MIDRLRTVTGTAEVLASLRRSLDGDGVTAPLPGTEPERGQTAAMLRTAIPVADAAAVVATSGSTGQPRGVVLSRAALVASATATHTRLGGPGTWVLALPPHYVAGLMVLVRSVVTGRAVVPVDARLSELTDLRPEQPAYLSLVPIQLTRALAVPALVAALGRFDAVLVGGAATDPAVLERARAAGIRVVTTYGMSETCGGCVYDGLPLDGVEIGLEPSTDWIVVGGPMLFSGYLGSPAPERHQSPTGGPFPTGDSFPTGDRGRWVDGRLEVIGRLDATGTSGGYNVDLDAVERALQRATDAEIAVIGVPDVEWGTRVVAVGVGVTDALAAATRDTVPAYALPRTWIAVPALPRTAGGKVDRQRLIRDVSAQVAR